MKLQHEWNGRFQEILSQPDSVEKFNSLSNLAQSFVDTAEQYGSIIIDELSLPYGKKTIKPGRYMHTPFSWNPVTQLHPVHLHQCLWEEMQVAPSISALVSYSR